MYCLQPDVCVLLNERLWVNDGKKFKESPDLVIEILSPSTEERDRTFKFREYARHGAKEYWLVSPDKSEVEVYQNSEKGFLACSYFYDGREDKHSAIPRCGIRG
ncbi:MAG: Uma2 family endonuclease [Bacteroidetes bacterium]|nr:MAG: Uma2 family endonuclease [Bacteroidota bacterium]